MNANELADAMEIRASIRKKATSRKSVTEGANDRLADQLDQAATMLRQQQAEIEALKANRKHDFGLGEASGFIKGHKENPYKAITNTKIEPTVVSYTHPIKELSETRIKQIFVEQTGFYFDDNPADDLALMDFAKALLLEAQEK